MSWTKAEEARLRRLARPQTLFLTEIAERLGKSSAATSWRARQLGIVSKPVGRMGEHNRKHVHLREPLLRYYLKHSALECQEHFGMTVSEFKSCLTCAYIQPQWRHIRKETRRHDQWAMEEKLFLIRHAGVQPREWIARKLRRGGVHAVKEELVRLNIRSKFMHGLPRKYLIPRLGKNCPAGIKTRAGPTGGGRGNFRFIVIPWVTCERLAREQPRRFTPEIRAAILGMAKFQRWIFGTKHDQVVIRKLKAAANAK